MAKTKCPMSAQPFSPAGLEKTKDGERRDNRHMERYRCPVCGNSQNTYYTKEREGKPEERRWFSHTFAQKSATPVQPDAQTEQDEINP